MNVPDDIFGAYILLTVAILYEYVPFVSLKLIVFVVDENDCPLLKLTYHFVPEGKPLSVNVMLYVTS